MLQNLGEAALFSALTQEQALALYKRHFWDHYKLETVKNQRFANFMLCEIVYLGSERVALAIQNAARELGLPIAIDGQMAPPTIWAANEEGERLLYYAYANLADFYCDLHRTNPAKYPKAILNLWLARLKVLVGQDVPEPQEAAAACP